MTTDVRVRRCALTVRGRGGWGWGTAADGYLAAALPAIERAVDQILRECDLDPDTDITVEEPMRIVWRADGTLPDDLRETLVAQVRRAAGAAETAPPDHGLPRTEDPGPPPSPATASGEAATHSAAHVATLLAEWSRSGRMTEIAASWPTEVVTLWLEAVRADSFRGDHVELEEAAVTAIADLVLAGQPGAPQVHGGTRVLVLLAALTAAAGACPIGPETVALAARAGAPAGPTATGADAPRSRAGARDASALATTQQGRARHGGTAAAVTRRRRTVAPGLPFLVLVQLGRIGYLDAVAAIGSATGEPLAAQVVAAGLAGKVLPAPQRGWRRDTAELEAVAAASGLPPDDVDALAHALRNEVRVCVPPLESALIALYAAGRAASDEVVVTSTAEGVVFGEPGGSLPIGWLSDRRGLDGALAQLGGPPVRRTDTFATFMSELAARTAFPHLGLTGLERHLGAAVGAALGSIAQELWGVETAGAGEDAPLLALERLGDLEVELRWDDVLAVAVPRGRRWLDLGRAGLLDQWAVPWAAGGVWELVSW